MSAPNPPFGLLAAGQPLITAPTSQPNPTSFLYAIPQCAPSAPAKPFSHLAVFLLPGIALPAGTAAAIYLAQNPSAFGPGGPGDPGDAAAAADFRFLGAVGEGKESAVFKLGAPPAGSSDGAGGVVVIGVNVEEAGAVGEKMAQLQASASRGLPPPPPPSTLVLAQRIIQNAFNFLSGFSGQVGTGAGVGGAGAVEVVPLKAFQDWWRKFEGKVKTDPSFLEREQD